MSWWLTAVAVVTAVTIFALAVIYVTKLVDIEERDSAWIPRIVAVVSVCAAFYTVLLLPLDVSSAAEGDTAPGVAVGSLWRVALTAYYVLLVTVIPFAMTHNEAWRPEQTTICVQLRPALLTTFVFTIVMLGLMTCAWMALGYVDEEKMMSTTVPQNESDAVPQGDSTTKQLIALDTFALAVAAVVGWVALIVFGGVGLVAVPLQGILSFRHRPQPISAAQFETERLRIHTASERLLGLGRRLEREAGPTPGFRTRRKMLALRRDARQLEAEYAQLETGFHLSGGSVIRSYISLCLSLVFACTSLVWALHILIYQITHVHPFLNNVLLSLQVFFPMASTLVYTWLACYLMLCVVVGCWTTGERLALFPVFALKMGKTTLNALLFNCTLLLVASLAVLQLCATGFDEYTKGTVILSMFLQTEQLFGVKVVFTRSPIPLVAVGLASLVWLLLCPHCCQGDAEDEDEYDL